MALPDCQRARSGTTNGMIAPGEGVPASLTCVNRTDSREALKGKACPVLKLVTIIKQSANSSHFVLINWDRKVATI